MMGSWKLIHFNDSKWNILSYIMVYKLKIPSLNLIGRRILILEKNKLNHLIKLNVRNIRLVLHLFKNLLGGKFISCYGILVLLLHPPCVDSEQYIFDLFIYQFMARNT